MPVASHIRGTFETVMLGTWAAPPGLSMIVAFPSPEIALTSAARGELAKDRRPCLFVAWREIKGVIFPMYPPGIEYYKVRRGFVILVFGRYPYSLYPALVTWTGDESCRI